jgi:hypothetical protein
LGGISAEKYKKMHKLRLKAYGVGHRARPGMELEEGNCGFWIADFGFKGKKLGIRIYERRWNIGMVE